MIARFMFSTSEGWEKLFGDPTEKQAASGATHKDQE
jgi:hypothetical protein